MNNSKLLSVLLAFALLLTGALPAVTASAKSYSLGDVNGDGKITSADARMILRVAAKIDSFSEAQEKAADVNRSGKVNSGDARTALRVAAKIETLTVGENEVFDDGRRESALDPANDSAVPAFIETLNSGRFLLRGTMRDYTGGETIPITFMKSDENIRMSAELSGIALDMAQIDGTLYLISSGKKSYIEMTESIMNTLGLDPDDLDLDFGEVDEGGDPDWTQREYDGRTVECCIITTEVGILEFYVENGTVLMLRLLDPSGVCHTEIDVEEFRGGVTQEEIAIPADYEKKSYVSFIADIMGDTEYETEPYYWPVIDELTPLDRTNEQILAKYTEVMNNTKTQAVRFCQDSYTELLGVDAGSASEMLYYLLNGIIDQDEPAGSYISENPSQIPPVNSAGVGCGLTDADAIEEAMIAEYGDGCAYIRITLKPEDHPLPMDPMTGVSPSATGGMFDVASADEVKELVDEKIRQIPGASLTSFDLRYYDCTVECTFDMETNTAISISYSVCERAEADLKMLAPMHVAVDLAVHTDVWCIDYE